jgi:3-oxoacyl-[acyl-carrier-protein] synthase III
MEATIKSVKLVGMQAAVPPHRHSFVETPEFFTQEEADKIYRSTGIHSRRILPLHLCASDMCLAAAENLLNRLQWDPKSVDVLIFATQDADYSLPATACVMQHRLGLAKTAACFDLTLGCSGFVYATWTASQLLNNSSGKRALVLCGDTSTRHLQKQEKGTTPLFGDAGVAVALEFDESWSTSHAVFGTDGSGAKNICVPAGGRRNPVIDDNILPTEAEQKQRFDDSRLHLNGPAVFSFTLSVVNKLVKETLALANASIDDVDMFVMHQANAFILEHLRKRAKIPAEKYLIDMKDFGNTSSASVPLAICHKLTDFFSQAPKKVLLGGFGVGWSWGAFLTDMQLQVPAEIIEIPDDFPPLTMS